MADWFKDNAPQRQADNWFTANAPATTSGIAGPTHPPNYEHSFAGDFITRLGDRVVGLGNVFTDPVGTLVGAMMPMVAPQVHAFQTTKRALEQRPGETAADMAFDVGPLLLGVAPRGVMGAAKFARHPIRTSAGWLVDAMQGVGEGASAASASKTYRPPPVSFKSGPAPVAPPPITFRSPESFEPVAPPPVSFRAEPSAARPWPAPPVNIPEQAAPRPWPAPSVSYPQGAAPEPVVPAPPVTYRTVDMPKPTVKPAPPVRFKPVDEPAPPPPQLEHPVTGEKNPNLPKPLPPVEGVHPDYVQQAQETVVSKARAGQTADTKLAAHLKEKNITPEQWNAADDAAKDAWAKAVGLRPFGNRGAWSRPAPTAHKMVSDRLSELWGR